jgi:hypothetical protein
MFGPFGQVAQKKLKLSHNFARPERAGSSRAGPPSRPGRKKWPSRPAFADPCFNLLFVCFFRKRYFKFLKIHQF